MVRPWRRLDAEQQLIGWLVPLVRPGPERVVEAPASTSEEENMGTLQSIAAAPALSGCM